jgi:hypothetical protein
LPVLRPAVLVAGLVLAASLVSAGVHAREAGAFSCAARALEVVQQRYGSVEVLTLLIYPTSADLHVRDPRQPSHVDRFSCEDGVVGEPEPVQAGRNQRRLEARLFELKPEQLALLPKLLPAAIEATETDDGAVTHVIVERTESSSDFGTSWSRPRFRVYVEGPRGGGFVEFRLDGKRGRVVRW